MTDSSSPPLLDRADVQAWVRRLAEPVRSHFSAGRARVRLGAGHAWYGEPGDLIEGFSRPLWGLVPLAAGGAEVDFTLWRQGFAAGTDPSHSEFWGWPGDYDQRIVEMAPMAFGFLLRPSELWDPLAPEVRQRVGDWLQRVNSVRPVDSNWLFFRVLVNVALQRLGLPWSASNVAADLERIEKFHQGNGWYSDGVSTATLRDGRVGDYYVPMGMHFYGLLYAVFASADDPTTAARYRERARIFAQDFVHWFAADGAALPFGRSLTYRFAQGAFWGALAFADVEALPWGTIKGIYLRHLRWWSRQPIRTDSGLLTIGYAYPNLIPAESYNGPGSPYWALKVFLPLALPETHPFWTAKEEPLPPRARIHSIPATGLVIGASADAAHVFALNAGQPVLDWPRHAPHKYSKFAYSTRFGFCVPVGSPTLAEGGFDSMLALSDDDRWFRHRDRCFTPQSENGVAFSRWNPWPDVEVRTWLVADDRCHVRFHVIKSGRPLSSAESGFAAGYDRRDSITQRRESQTVEIATPHGRSGLIELLGDRTPETVELGVNSHLLYPLSLMPALRGKHAAGEFMLACIAYGDAPDASAPGTVPAFRVETSTGGCVLFRDGERWWETSGDDCGISTIARQEQLRKCVTT